MCVFVSAYNTKVRKSPCKDPTPAKAVIHLIT